MLGMVFTEFIEMVEDRFTAAVADAVIEGAKLPHGGAYTSVGYYPHEEMVALVVGLSERTGVAVPDLISVFGQHLLGRFSQSYPHMFAQKATLFDFLESIDGEIHREVRKLYPDAQLPRFTVVKRTAGALSLAYESPRGMESLAEGLIKGAASHFAEPITIRYSPQPYQGRTVSMFEICKTA